MRKTVPHDRNRTHQAEWCQEATRLRTFQTSRATDASSEDDEWFWAEWQAEESDWNESPRSSRDSPEETADGCIPKREGKSGKNKNNTKGNDTPTKKGKGNAKGKGNTEGQGKSPPKASCPAYWFSALPPHIADRCCGCISKGHRCGRCPRKKQHKTRVVMPRPQGSMRTFRKGKSKIM